MTNLADYEPVEKDILAGLSERCEREEMDRQLRLYSDRFETEQTKFLRKYLGLHWFCEKCSTKIHKHGFKSINVYTKYGTARLQLQRFICPKCRTTVAPAHHLIPPNRVDACLAEIICAYANEVSYPKTSMLLQRVHKIFITPKSLSNIVKRDAKNMKDLVEQDTEKLFAGDTEIAKKISEGEKTMIVGIDGGFYSKHKRKGESLEAKVINISQGARHISGNRYELENRVGYATTAGDRAFKRLGYGFLVRNGVETADSIIVVSDGEPSIKIFAQETLPNAIHVLDMFHLHQKIQTTFGVNCQGKDRISSDIMHKYANKYAPERMRNLLSEWEPPDQRKTMLKNQLLTYIENNAELIANHLTVDIHGSGQIEKGVDLTISRRLKLRGMGWTKAGSSNIIKLKVLDYNKNWDPYWENRKGLKRCA
jgi:hypothetical protein